MKTIVTTISCLLIYTATFAQSDSSQIFFQKGVDEISARRYQAASMYLDKATQENPRYEQAYLQNAYANLAMNKSFAAKELFNKVYDLDPNNTDAINNLMQIYYDYRDFDKAREFALKSKTDKADRIIAMIYYQQEDYGNAITALGKVVAKNPNDAEANYDIARSYLEMEQDAQAIPFYRKAVEADPSKNLWAYELGLIYYNMDDYANAVDMMTKASANGYPHSNDFDENLGFAYIFSGKGEMGEKLLGGVMAKKPGDKQLVRDIADAFYKAKMYDRALDYCQKLMEQDKKDAKALYQAGMCFQKKGQKDRGQQMCDAAIDMDPSLAGLRQKQMMDTGL